MRHSPKMLHFPFHGYSPTSLPSQFAFVHHNPPYPVQHSRSKFLISVQRKEGFIQWQFGSFLLLLCGKIHEQKYGNAMVNASAIAHALTTLPRRNLVIELSGLKTKEDAVEGFPTQMLLGTSSSCPISECRDENGSLNKPSDEKSSTTHKLIPQVRHPHDAIMLAEAMLYFESIGLDFQTLIRKDPLVVKGRIERMKRVVHYLKRIGFNRKESARVLFLCPRLLYSAACKDLQDVVSFLMNEVGLSQKHLKKVISSCPRLLVCSVKERMRPTLRYLLHIGFTDMANVILVYASLLTFSIEDKLAPKLTFLESLGLSPEEAVCMVLRFPSIFNYSLEGNLKLKYRYLVDEMGGNLQDLKAFPQFFGFSLEKRIQPRHQLLLKKNICLSLPTLLKMSEKEFYARFGDAGVSLLHQNHIDEIDKKNQKNVRT